VSTFANGLSHHNGNSCRHIGIDHSRG
jgi:hypothetical protein